MPLPTRTIDMQQAARSKASISPSRSSLTMHTSRAPPSSCLRVYSALACARHRDHPGRRSTSATSGLELHSSAPVSDEPAATCGVRTFSAVPGGGDCAMRFEPMSITESAAAPKTAAPTARNSMWSRVWRCAGVKASPCNRGGRRPNKRTPHGKRESFDALWHISLMPVVFFPSKAKEGGARGRRFLTVAPY